MDDLIEVNPKDADLILPDKVSSIDYTVLREVRGWIYNRTCPTKTRMFIVVPDGTMLYRDHPSHRPYRKQRYFIETFFPDNSSKVYRMWRGTFIEFHLNLYKYLDKKKAKTLAEANDIMEE